MLIQTTDYKLLNSVNTFSSAVQNNHQYPNI